MATHVLPIEADPANLNQHEMLSEAALAPLRAKARAEGLWALQMPTSRGGGGLSSVGMAACYEEMGRSPFGPLVFNSAAPDDGNMMVLNKAATEVQKDRWLQPIIDGRVRSAFAMTETSAGLRFRPSRHDADHGQENRQRLDHPRSQMVYHRRPGRPAFHSSSRARPMIRARVSPLSCSTLISRAGRSPAASRSWGQRSTVGIVKSCSMVS